MDYCNAMLTHACSSTMTAIAEALDQYIQQCELELFEACGNSDVERVRELLDSGVDINAVDYDKGMRISLW